MPALVPTDAVERIVVALRSAGCVFAEDEAEILVSCADSPADLAGMVEQRVGGRPLEYVVGWALFCGRRIEVTDGVFVPRRRTEFLVSAAVGRARSLGRRPVVVDLCCGSGAVGTAMATELPEFELYAADVAADAVRCAHRNLAAFPSATVLQGDLFAALPMALRGRIDLLVVNAPYVPTDAIASMPAEARDYEDRVALDGGADGLDVARRVLREAPRWLASDGSVLIETSSRQAPALVDVMAAHGLVTVVESSEDLGATIVVGQLRTTTDLTSACPFDGAE